MDKYVSCSRCKYKILLEYKALQKLAGVERIDFFDFVCSHCEKEILHKRENYIDTTKHVVSHTASIKSTPSMPSIPSMSQYERSSKKRDNILHYQTKKTQKPKSREIKMSESSNSKESVATYDTAKMQEELKKACAGLKLKERLSKGNKYILKQIRDNYEKRIARPYAVSEQEQEYFRFCFPDKELEVPIQYTSNRSSTEIIKDMFEKEGVKYFKAAEMPKDVEAIGDGDWSSKIAKKYATENKLKCFDMKSFETFDRNKIKEEDQLKTTDIDGKGKEAEMKEPKKITKKEKFTSDKTSKKVSQKTKAIKKPKDTQKQKKEQKPSGDGDDQDGKGGKKKLRDTQSKQKTDVTDVDINLKKDTHSKEDLEESHENKSDEDSQWGKKKKGEGEGDELENAKKRHMESKDKIVKKSKEDKGKVSKIGVRDPNISNKKQSVLKDIIKRLKGEETSENLDSNELKVSKIGVRDNNRGVKKDKLKKLEGKKTIKNSELDTFQGDQEVPKGTIRYALSDRKYIDKGWTKLPKEKTVRKMLLYKMQQSRPEFDWFNRNKHKKEMFYNTGEKLAEFEDDEAEEGEGGEAGDNLKKIGRGDESKKRNKIYYRNGKVALEHYKPEEENNDKRIVIYSKGETDETGRHRPSTVLATFDHLGNGIIYDHDGNVRLKYNQTEGVLLDKTVGPYTHWKWHTLNDPPELKDVMTETVLDPKDMNIAKLGKPSEVTKVEDEEIQAIAMQNFIKSKHKKFKPYPVRMKAIKINEHFSLKLVDQATIYLSYNDHPVNVTTNIGMVLNQKDIVDTDLAEMGEVSHNAERIPPRTASLAALQSQRKHVQRLQRKRFERERLLRLKQSSIDRLYAGVSKPGKYTEMVVIKVDKECQCNLALLRPINL